MLHIEHTNDLGALEENAGFLAEDILLIGQFFRQRNGTGLPAGDGEARGVFGETDHTAPTTLSGLADMAGYTVHFRVLESRDADRIVGT